jgi:uncharacterized protein YbaA (DUF1428 family)
MHVHGAVVNEWIEANDSNSFQALVEHDGNVLNAQATYGNPAILHAMENEPPDPPSPELLAWQAAHHAESDAAVVARNEAYAIFQQADEAYTQHMEEWREAHPRPDGEEANIPF